MLTTFGGAEIARPDIARPDKAAPYRKGGHRETLMFAYKGIRISYKR